jgi:hypothetical protein
MHARGCAGIDCTGRAQKGISHFFHTFVTLPGVVRKESSRRSEKHNNVYIGLILKCNEIRENIRHWKKRQSFVCTWMCGGCVVPLDLAPSSKIPAGLLDPHYPRYRPANQFLPSRKYNIFKFQKNDRKKKIVRASLWTYFECDVIVSDTDLQLLLSDYIFLWPVCVIFPFKKMGCVLNRKKASVSQVMVRVEEIACVLT